MNLPCKVVKFDAYQGNQTWLVLDCEDMILGQFLCEEQAEAAASAINSVAVS